MATNICEKSFAVDARFCNFYAGGDVAWSTTGDFMYCLNTTEVCVVNVTSGQVTKTYSLNETGSTSGGAAAEDELEVDEDVIYAFALAANNEYLATAHRSGLLRLWSLETDKVIKLWKAQHKGPVVGLEFSPCCKVLCSSGADSTLRIWDFINSRCLNVLKEFPGPALVVNFHPNTAKTELFAVGADNVIYCWNYTNKELLHQLRGHLSQVTAMSFANEQADCPLLASVSRDKVLIFWELATGSQYKVIPMYEELEGVCFMREHAGEAVQVLVACAKGTLKSVNSKSAKMVTLLEGVDCETKFLLYCKKAQQLAVVTVEQNIMIYNWTESTKLNCIKQLIGFNDEILDLCYLGADDRFLVVATNSKSIKVYDTQAEMNCKIYAGHKDTVLTLSTPGGSNLLLSAGKDFSIFLWELQPDTFELVCIARQKSSHTATIGCIAFGHNVSSQFASVSQDGSMKVWQLRPDKAKPTTYTFQVKYSALAHEKEVNCVAFSPNNKMLATASQDKTVKLWSSETQATLGTLRGHTRGVWCVRFSPVDQIVLTSSSDCSLRIWALSNMSCLKRLEQECSILRAEFIDHGKFIVSAGSDGLLKLWNIKTNACVQTLNAHTARIWALAISGRSQKHFYSGGADSKLIRWCDITEKSRDSEISKRQTMLQQEQTLQSLLHQQQQMEKAFVLALTLGKPKTTYKIVSHFLQRKDMATVKEMMSRLNDEQRVTLLEHVKTWCTNSRHCHVANMLLEHILTDILVDPEQRLYNTKHLVEVLTPYVQRHFRRLTDLQKDLAFLDFMVACL